MGCGKSSVGKMLSELLYCRFIDLDSAIEAQTGCSINRIFSEQGEEKFRKLERDVLENLLNEYSHLEPGKNGVSLVLALGGGTIMAPECERLINSKTTCIYLCASEETLVNNLRNGIDRRPLLSSENLQCQVEALLSERSHTYNRVSHLVIHTDKKGIETIAEEIFLLIKKTNG